MQLALFATEHADMTLDQLIAHIETIATINAGQCPCWSWMTNEARRKTWIAAHFQQSDYGVNVDKVLFCRAYSVVGVKAGNLPASVLRRYEGNYAD